jgi:hypothetical protein
VPTPVPNPRVDGTSEAYPTRAGESTMGAGGSAGGSADGTGHPWVTRYELWIRHR